VAGRHRGTPDPEEGRRSTDVPFGSAGTPEQVKHFDTNVSRHSVVAADKRLFGEYPYDCEPGSKPTIDRSTGKRREQ
jgi:hypothetical protein